MSIFRLAIVALVLTAALSAEAPARGRGIGGPLGVMRFAVTRLFAPGFIHRHGRHGRHHVREARGTPDDREARGAPDKSQNENPKPQNENARYAVTAPPAAAEFDAGKLFTDPSARGQVTASAALALWHGERREGAGGWWSHGHGGYGWVGPLFWPLAYDDIYGYAILGDRVGFWDYGYRDIYAGIFAPYGSDDLAAYTAQGASGRENRKIPSLQELCGDASRIASLPIDRVRQAIQPTEAQRPALDDLAKASLQAAQLIQASCPRQTPGTAPARLALMRDRLEAMSNAVISLEWPLEKLYDSLDDGQKARLNALAEPKAGAEGDRAKTNANANAKTCDAAQPLPWPAAEIDSTLNLNDAQRAALDNLKRAAAYAADILNDECRPHDAATAPGRLLAVDQRLHDMGQAVGRVSAALEDFYATLSEAQKAQFEAIGPRRTA